MSTTAVSEPTESVLTQHFAKIHEPTRPQKSEVINVQQLRSPDGGLSSTRTSSIITKKDPSGRTQSIKFTEKEAYDPEFENHHTSNTGPDTDFMQNTGNEIAKKLSQLGTSGKITVSSKLFKNGEVTTITKTTNFGLPKNSETSEKMVSSTTDSLTNGTTPNRAGNRLFHSPSSIKDLLLRWCRDKTVGYRNVDITNFSRCWANGLAFCALVHSYYPESFDFDDLKPGNRRVNLELAFKTAEEKADIYPLLEVDDMIEMRDHPDWKCVFTYVQALYKGLRDKPCKYPYDPSKRTNQTPEFLELNPLGNSTTATITTTKSSANNTTPTNNTQHQLNGHGVMTNGF